LGEHQKEKMSRAFSKELKRRLKEGDRLFMEGGNDPFQRNGPKNDRDSIGEEALRDLEREKENVTLSKGDGSRLAEKVEENALSCLLAMVGGDVWVILRKEGGIQYGGKG